MALFVSDPAEDMAVESGGWSLEPVLPPGNIVSDFPDEAGRVYPQYGATTNDGYYGIYPLPPSDYQTVENLGVLPGAENEAMEVSPEENQRNLNFASEYAMEIVPPGLHQIERSRWTQAQAVAYINAFRGYILDNPELFTGTTYQAALYMNTDRPNFSGEITGLTIPEFFSNAVQGAAQSPVGQNLFRTPQQIADTAASLLAALNNAAKVLSNSAVLTFVLIGGALLMLGSRASGPIKDVKSIFR